MMAPYHEMIPIEKIKLDHKNPRIAQILEKYGENVSSEAIALALNGGASDSGTTYEGLRESIKTSGGVVHPIIVNKVGDEYTVIEGNTRVQIYQEFKRDGVTGNWEKISSIVYDDMQTESMHAIRLQSHLVGPRQWDPYAKAKYLSYLSNQEVLPLSEIISFAGGSKSEVSAMINAYNDMEKYYRPLLPDDDAFDASKFSFFRELQNRRALEALMQNGFTKTDYAKWVVKGNLDKAQAPRVLGSILSNKKAREIFLKSNATEAMKIVDADSVGAITDDSLGGLAKILSDKMFSITIMQAKAMIESGTELEAMRSLNEGIEDFLKHIDNMARNE